MICSVYRDRFIRPSSSGPDSTSSWPIFREHVNCSKAEAETSKGSEAHNRWRALALRGSETLRIRRHMRDWTEEMPYRISYIDTSMLTDEQMTKGILGTEEFSTEPAALARARELLEDLDCKMVLVSDNSGEHLSVVGVPLKPGLTVPRVSRRATGAMFELSPGRPHRGDDARGAVCPAGAALTEWH